MDNTEQAKRVRISALEQVWRLHHPYSRSEKQDQNIHRFFKLFTDAIADKHQFVDEVTLQTVAEFIAAILNQFAPATVKRIKSVLKSAFDVALPLGYKNYFALMKLPRVKNTEVIHRRPLSEAELKRLFAEAKKDPLIYSLVVTLACTGLRLADACCLRWSEVSLTEGVIDVITRKTGQHVIVPILPPFRRVLEKALAEKKDDNGFVFPVLTLLYTKNYPSLIRMGKLLFARSLFAEEAKRKNPNIKIKDLLKLTQQERKVGRRAGSLFGWHCLRGSFVVLALTNNIPLAIVQRIVGHTTVDTTLTHYVNPMKNIVAETFRRQMAGSVLGGVTAALPCENDETEYDLTLSIPVPGMSEPSVSQVCLPTLVSAPSAHP